MAKILIYNTIYLLLEKRLLTKNNLKKKKTLVDDGGEYLHNLTYSHLIGDARQSLTSIRDNYFRNQSQVQIQGLKKNTYSTNFLLPALVDKSPSGSGIQQASPAIDALESYEDSPPPPALNHAIRCHQCPSTVELPARRLKHASVVPKTGTCLKDTYLRQIPQINAT